MNAMTDRAPDDGPGTSTFAPAHRTHVFRLLLKREFWEHKGGFFWAPLITGGVFLVLVLMGMGIGELALNRAKGEVNINGNDVSWSALNFGSIVDSLSAKDLTEMHQAIAAFLYVATSWPLMVFAVVVFFYLLGALYDERRDRSVLFWKSLPLSDRETVLSKVATAVGVAPLLALGAGLLTMLGFLLLSGIFVALHGGNPFKVIWTTAPLTVAANLIGTLPIYVLWSLPTVGWLLLCSAWAKSKPILWAILVPVFAGIFVSWFDLMRLFDLNSVWFWQHVAGRMLIGMWPGSHAAYLGDAGNMGGEAVTGFAMIEHSYAMLARPELWVGAIAGAAMIYGAIRLRRWRDEG
jgi:ABC-2 type transport system permease protein